MKNMLERLREARAARQENREAGFSLIELIVVIAIIGILIAIAIPVYGNIQDNAKENQLKNAAATGASQIAAQIAQNTTPLTLKDTDDVTYSLGTGTDLDDFCVTATAKSGGSLTGGDVTSAKSGPGCS